LLQLKLEDQHELQQLAQHIQSATEKAAALTHGLLAYSRQQIIQLQHHDLRQLICLAEEFLGRILGDAISLQIICADQPLTIHADSLQIEQVLYNLAANARDAMPEGGSFTIETSLVPDDDSFLTSSDFGSVEEYALLIISDTGTGMDKETIKHLFDPFFTTKQVGKGTGLGMSVAYGIIRQHNGYIQVQSKPGKGTVFRIYLPLRDCDDSLQGGRGTKDKNQTDNADTE
jgi:signal transduction histidine kinase